MNYLRETCVKFYNYYRFDYKTLNEFVTTNFATFLELNEICYHLWSTPVFY